MSLQEFQHAMEYLLELYPDMQNKLKMERRVQRWFQRFGRMELERLLQTIDNYADDKDYGPTINALSGYIPAKSKEEPEWMHGSRDNTLPADVVKTLIAETIQKINTKEWHEHKNESHHQESRR